MSVIVPADTCTGAERERPLVRQRHSRREQIGHAPRKRLACDRASCQRAEDRPLVDVVQSSQAISPFGKRTWFRGICRPNVPATIGLFLRVWNWSSV